MESPPTPSFAKAAAMDLSMEAIAASNPAAACAGACVCAAGETMAVAMMTSNSSRFIWTSGLVSERGGLARILRVNAPKVRFSAANDRRGSDGFDRHRTGLLHHEFQFASKNRQHRF